MNEPIVTVSVLTYNSSKTVLETLDSIKAQTYPNLILQICDDCSTDATVSICEEWIKIYKERFVKTKIIFSDHNTGVSANCNRSLDACETEWMKEIAGDDMLMPECIRIFVNYIISHPDAAIVFSRFDPFGKSQEILNVFKNYDYTFFNLSPKAQYTRLLTKGNCIPAPTAFTNVKQKRELGIRADERIPLLEDLPTWIQYLEVGVKFHFVDHILVRYRVGENGLTSGLFKSAAYEKSYRCYCLYYQFPYDLDCNEDIAYKKVLDYEMSKIDEIYELKSRLHAVEISCPYRLGILILQPVKRVFDLCMKIVNFIRKRN